MAKSYHSTALPMHAAAIARLDVLRAVGGFLARVVDILLSVVSACSASSDLRVHLIWVMQAMSALLTMAASQFRQ
jgi:hypothetical protein